MKKTIIFLFLLGVVCSTIFLACSKSNSENEWVATFETNKYSTITDIFKSVNKAELINATSNNNLAKTNEITIALASKIASFVFEKYKMDVRKDFINDPQGVIILGLSLAAREHENGTIIVKTTSTDNGVIINKADLNCFFAVVGGVIGITDARNIWKSITAGASEETILAAVKVIGKRVAGIITVGIMVYELGECFDWW